MPVEEHYFNAITALSGSGPAYMYLVIEALADAGVRVGLRRDLALQLAAQTMLGSARMVLETGRHPASLRDDVTTPAGTTIGALLMLEDGKIRSVLARAVEEATKIAEERGRAVMANVGQDSILRGVGNPLFGHRSNPDYQTTHTLGLRYMRNLKMPPRGWTGWQPVRRMPSRPTRLHFHAAL